MALVILPAIRTRSDRSIKKINRDSEQVTTEKVYQEMDVQHALESHPSINGMCDYVGISRSGYYQREKRHNHQSPRKLRKKFIQGEIKAIWLKSLCIYGAGKITQELRSKGYKIAERTVGKYMRELGIHAVYLTPWTTTTRNSKFDKQLINISSSSIHCDQTPFGALTPLIFQFMTDSFI